MPKPLSFRSRSRGKNPKKELLSKFLHHRVPADLSTSAVFRYLADLDCPRALTVAILLRNKEYKQLCELDFNPSHHLESDLMHRSYCATLLFKKYQDFKIPDIDRRDAARLKFLKTEEKCKEVNQMFSKVGNDFLDPTVRLSKFQGDNVWLHNAVIRKISKILGSFDFAEFLDSANWGPGATTLIKRKFACDANKFQLETGITRDLYSVIDSSGFFSEKGFSPLWSEVRSTRSGRFKPTFELGNMVDFVPKHSLVDRAIAIEPGLNLWFQKSIGSMIRRRLRRVGINLNSQTRNQMLACEGSITNLLCTVDFSSASDSIATELVRELIPPEWFRVMDLCRSHYGVLDQDLIKWEKFSSMGNGFTFELQSLIFFAIAMCCCEKLNLPYQDRERVSVYGDDVIIPQIAFNLFSDLTQIYGFTINPDKSFVSSDFRESCGEHYFRGVSVRPIYLKRKINSISRVFRFHNAIRRLSHHGDYLHFCDIRFKRSCDFLVSSLPRAFRLWIPATLGDGGFIGNFDEACPPRNKDYIEGYNVLNLVETSRSLPFDGAGLLLASLWSLEQKQTDMNPLQVSRASSNNNELDYDVVSLRNSTKLKLVESCVRTWYDLGPWF